MITSAATGVNVSTWDFLDYYGAKVSFAKNVVFVNKHTLDSLDEEMREAVLKAAGTE